MLSKRIGNEEQSDCARKIRTELEIIGPSILITKIFFMVLFSLCANTRTHTRLKLGRVNPIILNELGSPARSNRRICRSTFNFGCLGEVNCVRDNRTFRPDRCRIKLREIAMLSSSRVRYLLIHRVPVASSARMTISCSGRCHLDGRSSVPFPVCAARMSSRIKFYRSFPAENRRPPTLKPTSPA